MKYEIQQSLKRGNALLGIHIHRVKSKDGRFARRGRVPHALKAHGSPVHDWINVEDFKQWVDEAWQAKNRKPGFFERLFGWR